jgi:response regulator of citrate/malate metabolism
MIRTIIVEDDPMVAMIDHQYLEKASPEITIAAHFKDGQSALDYLRTQPTDLVILDVYLPKCNGLDLLNQIRRERIETDIIMVTAARNKDEINEALRLGVIDYLVKPFEFNRFRQAIETYFQKRHIIDENTTFSQELIDTMSGRADQDKEDASLPKGLQQSTLQKITDRIHSLDKEPFTCKEMAGSTGLSIVTTQRYLNYLVSCEKLRTDVDYHTGGRPKLVYRRADENES